jgi:benzylsuccinate CoA-transferase BbsF subunit
VTAPLDGVRILDFTWVMSGPQATQILADFGAEVIRVEWLHHPDGLRYRVQAPDCDPGCPECGGTWNNLNRNKRSVSLNLIHPDGPPLALRLLEKCDVVVENFRPGVLESWGLGWDVMRARNPGLVYLSMSGFGAGGPNERYAVFGPVMQAVSGIHGMAGKPGREPAGIGFSYSDHVAGYFGAVAVLAALEGRQATGRGTKIDLSQVEASVALTSTAILDFQVNRRGFVGWGNVPFGSDDCPAGLYPCDGADAWCAISVRTESEWQAMTSVMADDQLTNDPRLITSRGRVAHREWTNEWRHGRRVAAGIKSSMRWPRPEWRALRC